MGADINPQSPIGNVVDYLFEHRLPEGERERTYLKTPTGDVSFGELHARTCQVGHLLRRCGISAGDRVLFSLRDGLDFVSVFLGVMKVGGISLPLNTFLKAKDYAYYLRDSGAKIVIIDRNLAAMFRDIVRELPDVAHVFVAGGNADEFQSLDDALADMPAQLDTVECASGAPAFWLYSSGSTGDPKGVVHTHDHIYWATELFGIGAQGVSRDDVIVCPAKMFFAYGLGNQVYFPLRVGARVVTDPEPARVESVLARLVEHRPTLFVAVPTIFAGLVNLMRGMDRDGVRHACARLRFGVSGGEVLPPSLLRAWQEHTGVDVLDGVGTTEMTHMFIINRPGHVVPGSCGRLLPGYRARLVDENWNDVAPGEVGNLFVAGPTAATEYWNKPEKTRATMRDGGVLTGDKFYQDPDGNFFYVGRIDDMLRVGGIWVSPAEVESALTEDPRVLECAVIGCPDEQEMVKPKAFVVLRPGTEIAPMLADEIRENVRAKLAHHKCPRWIEFVTELPKTATGKIQRFRLRQMAAERAAA
jgi:benzoate-CoA ligase family protein